MAWDLMLIIMSSKTTTISDYQNYIFWSILQKLSMTSPYHYRCFISLTKLCFAFQWNPFGYHLFFPRHSFLVTTTACKSIISSETALVSIEDPSMKLCERLLKLGRSSLNRRPDICTVTSSNSESTRHRNKTQTPASQAVRL